MSTPFNPRHRLIVVRGDVEGPAGAVFRLVLDTGSTRTVLDRALSNSIGLTPDPNLPLVLMTGLTGVVNVPQAQAASLVALERRPFAVVLHDLPPTRFDGVLGLDFLRGAELSIDFQQRQITLH